MKIDELIRARRTIHQYKPEKVADDLVMGALEVALWAPNHKLTFPWRFIVVGDQSRGKIANLAVELKSNKKQLSQIEIEALRSTYMKPSHLIVLAMVKNPDPETFKEDYAAVAIGVQNMSLFLWAQGVGSKWSTGAVISQKKTYEHLGCHAPDEVIVGFFWIGVPDGSPRVPKRPLLNEVLRHSP